MLNSSELFIEGELGRREGVIRDLGTRLGLSPSPSTI